MLRIAGVALCMMLGSVSGQGEEPFYGPLNFGDSSKVVFQKLKKWPYVSFKGSEALMGRMGMNETFHTTQDLGGSTFALLFEFGPNDKLAALDLYSVTRFKDGEYDTKLKALYDEACALVTQLYGAPQRKQSMPGAASLGRGGIQYTHIFSNKKGGSVRVGVCKDGQFYRVAIRMQY